MTNPVVDTVFTTGTTITSGWLNGVNDFVNGQRQVTVPEFTVDTIAALKALSKVNYNRVFVFGYYTAGDGGGGDYWFDPTDTTSLDNGGSILVAADGGRWKLAKTTSFSVKQFGAKGDGTTDDTAAIQAAFNALSGGAGELRFPTGTYMYTQLVFDSAVGLKLTGDGAIGTSILRCSSTTVTGGVKLRSVFDCTAQFLTFDHSSASFTGYLATMEHKPSSSSDTQGMYFFRCTFGSQGFNLYSANGVKVDQATLCTFEGCKFGSLSHPVDGQNPAGGSYSNGIRFKNCQFFDNVGYALNYLGEQWTAEDCNFQAAHDGTQKIAFSSAPTSFIGLCFKNCGIYDAVAAGSSYLNLGPGTGLTVEGGLWGGRSDLGSSAFLNAGGIISGISVKGVRFSLFTNVFVAGVAGQVGWDLSGGNTFANCTTIIANPNNVTGLSLDLNSPNSSLGTFATNGVRYNQDGTVEMWGTASSVASGSLISISFPQTFGSAIWNITAILVSPAATGNVLSLGTINTSSFQVFINGSGTSSVMWRAIGK